MNRVPFPLKRVVLLIKQYFELEVRCCSSINIRERVIKERTQMRDEGLTKATVKGGARERMKNIACLYVHMRANILTITVLLVSTGPETAQKHVAKED